MSGAATSDPVQDESDPARRARMRARRRGPVTHERRNRPVDLSAGILRSV